ncbi:glycosyltransferase family 4 protein [Nostoc sp. FACHB-110]|uniref:glycosyltransferase family 4 protein n=1 Tax=Nostoc sp. FACHB-110 TaxID=2692834 RepID=UPI001688A34C|nr:glycosyltransferase family 4 protein [Nostoc sp. FACHB-110]MBD2437153.1 glycosyltransferase family 4 protein [Nostoc sp. FACHB-110]
MEEWASDTLSLWRKEGNQRIKQNFQVFRCLVAQARDHIMQSNYNAAAAYAQIAGLYAQNNHCGFFVSPELEHILLTIGQKTIPKSIPPNQNNSFSTKPKNILHVATNVFSPFSGIPRLLRRWIEQDTERSHSLVLTRQVPSQIPQEFKNAVLKSQGQIYRLNAGTSSYVSRAKRLRKYATFADMVVLHTWEHDVIPTIAFANKDQCPPVLRVNHGDHCFWFGGIISDVIVNLRESGMRLTQERRGIEPHRNMLLPTVIEPMHRKLSRAEAKEHLGISKDSVLLLSIARGPKYKTIDGINFAEAHVPLLKQHKQAILLVIGPGDSEDWSAAIQQTEGRIQVLGQSADTAIFYQAADIYVDSFPFISNTSLLEAGCYGLPLVTRSIFSNTCEILAADMPGLTGNMIRVRNLEEYTKVIAQLIEDAQFRISLGEATRRKITETHMGSNWLQFLEDIYLHSATLPPVTIPVASIGTDEMFLGEPDVYMPIWFSTSSVNIDPYELIKFNTHLLPLDQRLHIWLKMIKMDNFGKMGHISRLLPEEMLWHLQNFLSKN